MKSAKELPEKGKFVALFVSDHCPHCKTLQRTMKQVEKKYADREIEFFIINISKNHKIAEKYGIRSVPFTVFMNGKKLVGKEMGDVSQRTIEINIEDLLKDGELIKKIKKIFGIG